MVGKLFLDLGDDYAYDIRRARQVAEGETPGGPDFPPPIYTDTNSGVTITIEELVPHVSSRIGIVGNSTAGQTIFWQFYSQALPGDMEMDFVTNITGSDFTQAIRDKIITAFNNQAEFSAIADGTDGLIYTWALGGQIESLAVSMADW